MGVSRNAVVPVRPLSRAGSLPQGMHFNCGSEPAREDYLTGAIKFMA
ncbi:hypothetical protein PG5_22620 [Pseudomonas sp. G5(2012)]|nr:hypothetical protein PG5_22620 [Pseudomonas sp. G5(2012)]